jgi:hypothetical protein
MDRRNIVTQRTKFTQQSLEFPIVVRNDKAGRPTSPAQHI